MTDNAARGRSKEPTSKQNGWESQPYKSSSKPCKYTAWNSSSSSSSDDSFSSGDFQAMSRYPSRSSSISSVGSISSPSSKNSSNSAVPSTSSTYSSDYAGSTSNLSSTSSSSKQSSKEQDFLTNTPRTYRGLSRPAEFIYLNMCSDNDASLTSNFGKFKRN